MIGEEMLARINGPYRCPPDAGPAWRAACDYGFDMSVVDCELGASPEERIERHQHAINMVLEIEAAREGSNLRIQNNRELLTKLRQHRTEFIVTADLCGVIHASSILATTNLEICC